MNEQLLTIRNLSVTFKTSLGILSAVEGFDLDVYSNDLLAIVGESGSGKSVSMLAMMGLLPWTATITADKMEFAGQDMQHMSTKQRRKIIGNDITMIFQEPITSLNPCFTVGYQIAEALAKNDADRHGRSKIKNKSEQVIDLLASVGIPAPEKRKNNFPHQLSGGMNQRVMIAMALASRPRLLIADEPTTALDVTIQAQILDLLLNLQQKMGMALILITHDMGVVAETARRVMVKYAGRIVERHDVERLFANPSHPYTKALLESLPERSAGTGDKDKLLPSIKGTVPGIIDRPDGCLFSPRCQFATAKCYEQVPARASDEFGYALCHYPLVNGTPQNYPGDFRADYQPGVKD